MVEEILSPLTRGSQIYPTGYKKILSCGVRFRVVFYGHTVVKGPADDVLEWLLYSM